MKMVAQIAVAHEKSLLTERARFAAWPLIVMAPTKQPAVLPVEARLSQALHQVHLNANSKVCLSKTQNLHQVVIDVMMDPVARG